MANQAMESLLPYGERAWRLAWAFMRNREDADDVVQAAFVVAASKPHAVPRHDPWSWFGGVVANIARNTQRSRRRRQALSIEENQMDLSDANMRGPERQSLANEQARLLWAELDRLADHEREALVLTKISGLSREAAARVMDVSVIRLDYLTTKGLERLRKGCVEAGLEDEGQLASWPVALPALGIEAATGLWSAHALAGAASASATQMATRFIASHPAWVANISRGGLLMKRITIAGAAAALMVSGWLGLSAIYGDADHEDHKTSVQVVEAPQPPKTVVPVVNTERTTVSGHAAATEAGRESAGTETVEARPEASEASVKPSESYQKLVDQVKAGEIISPAALMPSDIQVYLEIRDAQKLLHAPEQLQWLGASGNERATIAASAQKSIEQWFGQKAKLGPEASRKLWDSIRRVGYGLNFDIAKNNSAYIAIYAFSDATALEVLTASEGAHFVGETPGKTGRGYYLFRKRDLPDAYIFPALNTVVFSESKQSQNQSLSELVAVIEGGAPSLASNPAYQAALKSEDAGTDVFAALMPKAESTKTEPSQIPRTMLYPMTFGLFDFYNPAQTPVTAGLRMTPEGSHLTLNAQFGGGLFPPPELFAEPQLLTIGERLPKGTVGYVAASTKLWASHEEAGRVLKEWLGKMDAALPEMRGGATRGLDEITSAMEKAFGLTPKLFADAMGEQIAFGSVLVPRYTDEELAEDEHRAQSLEQVFVAAMDIGDKAKITQVLNTLKTAIPLFEDRWKVNDLEGGFEVVSKNRPVSLVFAVAVKGDTLHFVAPEREGNVSCVAGARAAFKTMLEGRETLADDGAHRMALARASKPASAFAWFDCAGFAGHWVHGVMKPRLGDPTRNVLKSWLGVDVSDTVVLSGDKRVTSFASLAFHYRGAECKARVEGWNIAEPMLLFGLYGEASRATNIGRAMATEAVRSIGVIKQQLEMWHMENPNAAMPADLTAWEAAGGPKKASFIGSCYEDYHFVAGASFDANSGRFVGTIVAIAKPMNPQAALNVSISFEADGRASEPVLSNQETKNDSSKPSDKPSGG